MGRFFSNAGLGMVVRLHAKSRRLKYILIRNSALSKTSKLFPFCHVNIINTFEYSFY